MGVELLNIPKEMMADIYKQAKNEYPHECCGMIFGPKAEKLSLTRLRACENVQNKHHELDPETFPRTSATAYFIDPRELLAIQKETREKDEEIRIIYHSHIDVGAYFSEEDKRVATSDGEPVYPGVQYLVVSVLKGEVDDSHLFYWNSEKGDFVS